MFFSHAFFSCAQNLGQLIFTWLQRQCNEVENKKEYEKSYKDFKWFLNDQRTVRHLSVKCWKGCLELQENLHTKVDKIGNHIRHCIHKCMDELTTSPVMSSNCALKNGSHAIHLIMNLDNTCTRALDGVQSKILHWRNAAQREMAHTNNASRGVTKEFLIRKGQGLVDKEHGSRMNYCCAQEDNKAWYIWCFENGRLKSHQQGWQWNVMTCFHHVRKVTLESVGGKKFMKCSCCYRERVGMPCWHVWWDRITNHWCSLAEGLSCSLWGR